MGEGRGIYSVAMFQLVASAISLATSFLFHFKTHLALILLLLASNRDPLCWARGWGSRPAGGFCVQDFFLFPLPFSLLPPLSPAFRIFGGKQ